MKILFLSAEVEPFAKVGGLADVAGSLPKALSDLGHEVRVVMPAYGMVVNDPQWNATKVRSQVPVTVNPTETVLADVYEVQHEGTTVWLVDGDHFFGAVSQSTEVYTPGRDAYLFFAQAALEACKAFDWVPDVVHANDWHTAFAPVFLREKTGWTDTASVFTVHNLAYQGEFGPDTVEAAGLPASTFNWKQLETWGKVNFLKSGCVYADQVNTVSPTYAQEIQTEGFGCGLQGLMAHLASHGRLRGIVNGIDTVRHDPETDPRIPGHFEARDLKGKKACRTALCDELGLVIGSPAPVLSIISRLSDQKGFDLILDSFEALIDTGAALVVLAVGDPAMATRLRDLDEHHHGVFRFVEAYDADFAQRIYAGSDIFLMPSSFEPCGLGQLFAMRYGTIPVARKTGGLADTVVDGETGFLFEERTAEALTECVSRAVDTFRDQKAWLKIVTQAMSRDSSWATSAKEYVAMYEEALASRRQPSRKRG